MTKEIKNILKKDLKKYETLVNITEGEAQEIYMEVVMFLKELIDTGTDLLSILTDVIEMFGTIPTLVTAIVAAMSFKNIGKDKMFSFTLENMPMVMLFPLDIVVFDITLNEIH